MPTHVRTVKDKHTGERKSIEMPLRIRQWWFVTESGSVALPIRYGSKLIEFAKGKNAIEVTDGDQLIKALTQIKEAVLAGELDGPIEQAANVVRSRFKK